MYNTEMTLIIAAFLEINEYNFNWECDNLKFDLGLYINKCILIYFYGT